MKRRSPLRKGFTAIELLIIVAIVGVLAMVAVPRLIDSQTRAKLSRIKTEMRKGKMALEAFHFDHKWYPPDGFWLMGYWGQVSRRHALGGCQLSALVRAHDDRSGLWSYPFKGC